MATHTKVIDLFGIPACGKSTLCEYMSTADYENVKIVSWLKILHDAKKHPMRLFMSIGWPSVFAGIRLRCSIPRNMSRKTFSLKKMLLKETLYRYAIKYSEYDIVLVDHGIVQSFVSLESGEDLHLTKTFNSACLNYLDTTAASIFAYCYLPVKEALERMHKRNRHSGRIDKMDIQNRQEELEDEQKRFEHFYKMIQSQSMCFVKLHMMNETPQIAEELLGKCSSIY